MIRDNQKGFTLIELAAVVGVIAVTTAVLLVNNHLNQLQISLTNNSASVAAAVSRAKALTLQNLNDSICGYGVHFIPGVIGGVAASYEIFKDVKVNGVCDHLYTVSDVVIEGGSVGLDAGLNFISNTNITGSTFIQDVVFYSSDARVKLTGFDGQDLQPSGVVIITTEAATASSITLKITTTGQVTSKTGAYVNSGNFDSGLQSQFNITDGQFVVTGESQNQTSQQQSTQNNNSINPLESCIPDCSCANHLASGQTCSDGCGGTCYPGISGCISDPSLCAGKTCSDKDNCGAPCVVCSSGQACINSQCVICTPNCTGKVCGDSDGCGGKCTACSSGYVCNIDYQCVSGGVQIIINSVEPSIFTK
jgi:prepilin-type N-terminal cleavage/methylation domain-containing protein